MAPIHVDPDRVHEFADAESFYTWLLKHHDTEDEVWINIRKLASGLKAITAARANDVVLCLGKGGQGWRAPGSGPWKRQGPENLRRAAARHRR